MHLLVTNPTIKKEIKTDHTGLQILSYLLQNFKKKQAKGEKYYTTYTEISEALNIPISTVYRRVSRFKRIALIHWHRERNLKSLVVVKPEFKVKYE